MDKYCLQQRSKATTNDDIPELGFLWIYLWDYLPKSFGTGRSEFIQGDKPQ
ncbi:hypothetical protein [Saccharicrinis sp. GN24d3]|uniref:hypothetical protein n=1 Tax=Saccharicrinis sp. GN24d3 TaxID=3458416 RepID=UPI004035E594